MSVCLKYLKEFIPLVDNWSVNDSNRSTELVGLFCLPPQIVVKVEIVNKKRVVFFYSLICLEFLWVVLLFIVSINLNTLYENIKKAI